MKEKKSSKEGCTKGGRRYRHVGTPGSESLVSLPLPRSGEDLPSQGLLHAGCFLRPSKAKEQACTSYSLCLPIPEASLRPFPLVSQPEM